MKRSSNNRCNRPPMFMSAAQMSMVSGVGENTLRQLMDERKLEYLRIGKRRLLCKKAIKKFYKRYKTPAYKPQKIEKTGGDQDGSVSAESGKQT